MKNHSGSVGNCQGGRSADNHQRSDEPNSLPNSRLTMQTPTRRTKFAVRAGMRNIMLGRRVGSAHMIRARSTEKGMITGASAGSWNSRWAWRRARSAMELKRQGWFAWTSDHESISLRIERVRANDTEKELQAIASSRSGLKVGGGLAEISNGASSKNCIFLGTPWVAIRAVIAKELLLCKTTPPMRRKATFYPVAGLFAG